MLIKTKKKCKATKMRNKYDSQILLTGALATHLGKQIAAFLHPSPKNKGILILTKSPEGSIRDLAQYIYY